MRAGVSEADHMAHGAGTTLCDLAAEPCLQLLDESFGALDLQIRESMQEFLHALQRHIGPLGAADQPRGR